jgi:hypothetical protein
MGLVLGSYLIAIISAEVWIDAVDLVIANAVESAEQVTDCVCIAA